MAVIKGDAGDDMLVGTRESDSLNGLGGNDKLYGLRGNDEIDGGEGADLMVGRFGDDTYWVDDIGDQVREFRGEGFADVVNSSVSFTLQKNIENLVLIGTDSIFGRGNDYENHIVGNAGDNRLDGGLGADILEGGLGDDVYIVTSNEDTRIERPDEGEDTIISDRSFALGAHFEILRLTGTASFGTGNAAANTLYGNDRGNHLDGGAGADVMLGRGGDDLYLVDDSADRVIEADDDGHDTVHSTADFKLGRGLENLSLTGAAAQGVGNDLNNVITVSSAANFVLAGRGGDDTLVGGSGNGRLLGGDGNDTLTKGGADLLSGGAGDDILFVSGTIAGSRLRGGAGDDLITLTHNLAIIGDFDAGSSGFEAITAGTNLYAILGNAFGNVLDFSNITSGTVTVDGGEGDDVLTSAASGGTLRGGEGNDTLVGGRGTDRFSGGSGNDIYYVNNISDTVEEDFPGLDIVYSTASFTLPSGIEQFYLIGNLAINGTGGSSNNFIAGNNAANILNGSSGGDRLKGNGGADEFRFDTFGVLNFDAILDFTADEDLISLVAQTFSAVGPKGMLQEDAFHVGTEAQDLEDRIIYDPSSGRIYYDRDGSNNFYGKQVFAVVDDETPLTHEDFIIV